MIYTLVVQKNKKISWYLSRHDWNLELFTLAMETVSREPNVTFTRVVPNRIITRGVQVTFIGTVLALIYI